MPQTALERIQLVFDGKAFASAYEDDQRGHFSAAFLRNVEIIDAEQSSPTLSRLVWRFPVTHEYLNGMRNLHGGAVATIFDICTSWLLFFIQKPGFWSTMGVSRTLTVNYLRPASEGEMLTLDCEIIHAGKRLALLTGTLKRERDGAVVATCEHNKVNVDADTRI